MDPTKQQSHRATASDVEPVDDVSGQPPNESPSQAVDDSVPEAESRLVSAKKEGNAGEKQGGTTAVVDLDADATQPAKPSVTLTKSEAGEKTGKSSLKNVVVLSNDMESSDGTLNNQGQGQNLKSPGEQNVVASSGSRIDVPELMKEEKGDTPRATAVEKSSDPQQVDSPLSKAAALAVEKIASQGGALNGGAAAKPSDGGAAGPAPTTKKLASRDETPSNDSPTKEMITAPKAPSNTLQDGKGSNGLQPVKTIVKSTSVSLPIASQDAALKALKKEVASLNTTVKSMSRQMAVIISNTTKVKDEPSVVSKGKTSRQESPQPRKKRKESTGPDNDICICFDSGKLTLLRSTIVALVQNFVQSMPCLRLWLSDDPNPKAVVAGEFSNSQILEQLFFLKTSSQYCPTCAPPGRFVFYIMNKSLRLSLSLGRKALDTKEGSEEVGKPDVSSRPTACRRGDGKCPVDPKWLSYFACQRDIDMAMADSWRTAEGAGTVEKEEQAPTTASNNEGDANALDLFCRGEICCHVVEKIRSMWLKVFSLCQRNARNQFSNSFGFVLQEIVRRRSETGARTHGFAIRLNTHGGSPTQHGDGRTEVLLPTHRVKRHALWDMPKASTGAAAIRADGNIDARRKLERAFRSLHCTVEYEKTVYSAATGGSPRAGSGVAELNRRQILTANITEKVSLIEVANRMLMEVFGFDSEKEVLASSSQSLKAILVLAIALRGHIVMELKKSGSKLYALHDREQAALGIRKGQ